MTPKRKKELVALLSGYVPPDLRSKQITPTDADEVYFFAKELDASDLRSLCKGPRGEQFLVSLNRFLLEYSIANPLYGKRPGNSKVSTGIGEE